MKSTNRSSGFSLVEVLVAIALLAVAMLALAPLFTGGMRSNAVGWDYSMLNTLAKQRLEEVLQYNFADARLAVPAGATATIDDPANPGSTITVTGQMYTNQLPLTQTVGGATSSFPYKTVYMVQDYRLADIPQTGLPLAANAKADNDATWNARQDVKLVTVIGLSIRQLQGDLKAGTGYTGSPYTVAMFHLTANELPGKQIRMSAIKSP